MSKVMFKFITDCKEMIVFVVFKFVLTSGDLGKSQDFLGKGNATIATGIGDRL
jgi:hypothetical protein